MKVYLAGAIRGDRSFAANYRALIEHVEAKENCEALAEPTLIGKGIKLEEDAAIYERDRAWLDQADAMIAEISAPSLGVGYEIAYALHVRRIPVLALFHCSAKRPSAMLTGNPSPLLQIQAYGDVTELEKLADEFIEKRQK